MNVLLWIQWLHGFRNYGVKLYVFLGGSVIHVRLQQRLNLRHEAAVKTFWRPACCSSWNVESLEGKRGMVMVCRPGTFLLAGKSSQNTWILWGCGNIHYSQKVMDVWFSDEGYGKGSSYSDIMSWKLDGEAEACNSFIYFKQLMY